MELTQEYVPSLFTTGRQSFFLSYIDTTKRLKYYKEQVLTMSTVKTVVISDDQQEFLKNSTINFSALVRKCIDEEIKKDG